LAIDVAAETRLRSKTQNVLGFFTPRVKQIKFQQYMADLNAISSISEAYLKRTYCMVTV